MLLSKYNLKNITTSAVSIPDTAMFELPEKILQFGTGVLLRGLPDYFIDKANKQGIFNGRIVVVKSTDSTGSTAFDKQDGLYTLCVRGIEAGVSKNEDIISASISRVLSARNEWNKILECAHNPQMQIIISNTTEIGIALVHDDIMRYPPVSFPGKLLAFLVERYKAFAGSKQCGMVIIPTELITDNGKKLESIVTELAYLNGLDETFIDWLENCNHFCNSLVDRIVPGKPGVDAKSAIEKKLGYSDELLITCEPYRLWAIEGDAAIKDILSFADADDGVVVTTDINLFRELKLRLLNGTHTLSCGVAILSGFTTVKEAMDDTGFDNYISSLMECEIAKAIPYAVEPSMAEAFAKKVIDRFHNPQIEHQWLSITVQYTTKMKMRVVPLLVQHYKLYNNVPENISLGFAAYILFMHGVKKEEGNYFGLFNGDHYPINDDKASFFYEMWQTLKPASMAAAVLSDIALWGQDLSVLPGFAAAVQEKMTVISTQGITAILHSSKQKKVLA